MADSVHESYEASSPRQFFNSLAAHLSEHLERELPRGLITTSGRVFPLPSDTKLLSKVFEVSASPLIQSYSQSHNVEVVEADTQIKYPDFSLRGKILGTPKWVALDLKSSYRKPGNKTISGFTLGSCRGSLRQQDSTQYSVFPYSNYSSHWILCVIYSRREFPSQSYSLDRLKEVPIPFGEIEVYIHEKYRLAVDRLGSGNTANIGSVTKLTDVIAGAGPFAKLGSRIFEDYWKNYMRREDARQAGLGQQPYKNLKEYLAWQKINNS